MPSVKPLFSVVLDDIFSVTRPHNVIKTASFLLFICLFSSQMYAQTELDPIIRIRDTTVAPAKATIGDVRWISGYWTGEALGGHTEEIWSDTLGSSMMGSFRLVLDGEVRFYELMALTEESGTLVLRIKHFNPDLKGWEEKNQSEIFSMVALTDNCAYFDGLTFEYIDPDKMTIHVLFTNKTGEQRVVPFPYTRKRT